MKVLPARLTSSLAKRINKLVRRVEAAYPGMPEVAAMVYVGDVYVLREQRRRRHVDGWGGRRYGCESGDCRRLPWAGQATGVSGRLPQSDHEPG